jgi:hypothetical protein
LSDAIARCSRHCASERAAACSCGRNRGRPFSLRQASAGSVR